MKTAIALLLLVSATGWATMFEMPKLFPESCGGVQYAYSSERVYERTQCPTGGRGSRPLQVVACAEAAWNADGSIARTETLWLFREKGTSYPHAESCL